MRLRGYGRPLCASVLIATLSVTATAALGAPASAATTWTINGPTGSAPISARLTLTGSGGLTFAVHRNSTAVLAPAPIGIQTSTANLTTGLRFVGRADRTLTQQYTMTAGKKRERTSVASESTFSFAGTGSARVDVQVRVSAEGAAYRYLLPGTGNVTVLRESSSWSVPTNAPAWVLPYSPNYEEIRYETTAGGAPTGDFGFPTLFDVNGTYVLLTESDVTGRYSAARLAHTAGSSLYRVKLDGDAAVTAPRLLVTPWRVAIVGTLANVTESTLVDDLAPPSRISDTSWIRPGMVAWSWLSEHDSPRDEARQRQYVDFAARNGWPYILIDEGWSATWVPDVVRYARSRGVEIILWFRWSALDTAQERDTMLPLLRSWGVAGLKIDFMDSDSQARFKWYDEILAKTAEYKLMVNFHGATIPRGMQRTWPHVLTLEAIRGAEQYKYRATTNTMFPFTRNVTGSMDYTPATFIVTDRDTTDAHEVADLVVFESGWQHAADKFENYEARPEALRTINQLPTVWDDTLVLGGRPGREAYVARRNGERWFLGGLSAVPAKTFQTPLYFVGGGQFLAETLRDGPAGGFRRETQVVNAGTTFSVPVATNGGFVTVVCPYTPGLTTCDRPIRTVPRTNLTVTPATAEVPAGQTLSVTATFTLPSGGPITNVEMGPTPPADWTVKGAPVTAPQLTGGQSITGTWQLTAPQQIAPGNVDLPVVATYRIPDDATQRPVHVETAVKALVPPPNPTGNAYISDLPFLTETNGWGPAERDRSNGEIPAGDGTTLSIRGRTYAKGVGVHSVSELTIWLGRACSSFHAEVGIDDEAAGGGGSVDFQVLGDGRALGSSGVVRNTDQPRVLTADLTGIRTLTLRVTDGGDDRNFDHGDWADARVICT
jgi:alpha-glucosidase